MEWKEKHVAEEKVYSSLLFAEDKGYLHLGYAVLRDVKVFNPYINDIEFFYELRDPEPPTINYEQDTLAEAVEDRIYALESENPELWESRLPVPADTPRIKYVQQSAVSELNEMLLEYLADEFDGFYSTNISWDYGLTVIQSKRGRRLSPLKSALTKVEAR